MVPTRSSILVTKCMYWHRVLSVLVVDGVSAIAWEGVENDVVATVVVARVVGTDTWGDGATPRSYATLRVSDHSGRVTETTLELGRRVPPRPRSGARCLGVSEGHGATGQRELDPKRRSSRVLSQDTPVPRTFLREGSPWVGDESGTRERSGAEQRRKGLPGRRWRVVGWCGVDTRVFSLRGPDYTGGGTKKSI